MARLKQGDVAAAVLMTLGDSLAQRARIVEARDVKRRPNLARGEGIDASDRQWFKGWHLFLQGTLRPGGALERDRRMAPVANRGPLEKLCKRLQTADQNIAAAFDKLQRGTAPGAFDKLTRDTAPSGVGAPKGSARPLPKASPKPSPAVPVIAPRPQVNPTSLNSPMTTENAITVEAAAMVLARRYNRPQPDVSKALRATVVDRVAKVGFTAAMCEAQEGLVWRLDRGLI